MQREITRELVRRLLPRRMGEGDQGGVAVVAVGVGDDVADADDVE